MNLSPEANGVATKLADEFVRFLARACPAWEVGFFRFALGDAGPAATASIVVGAEVAVVDHPGVLDLLSERGKALFGALGRSKGVVLFVVGASSRQCEIRFDLEDLERWTLEAGTGMPRGL